MRFPNEIGRLHGVPLIFFDTNILLNAEPLVKQVLEIDTDTIRVVICDFIDGEVVNLKKGLPLLNELKNNPKYSALYFETKYNSREGALHALADMPTGEMAEAVLIEYDKKLDPTGMEGKTKDAKSAARSKSKFGDFSLLTVATISAFKRKKQAVVVSRDRWIKLSCKSLQMQFKLPIYCYDQWTFSLQEIISKAQNN